MTSRKIHDHDWFSARGVCKHGDSMERTWHRINHTAAPRKQRGNHIIEALCGHDPITNAVTIQREPGRRVCPVCERIYRQRMTYVSMLLLRSHARHTHRNDQRGYATD